MIRGGKVTLTKSYVYADLASKKRIDEGTVYRVASLGKPVVTYIVVSLAQQGKIDLDVPGSVAEAMLKPQEDVARNVRWGQGWGLQDTVPNYSLWHRGSMAGFRHYVVGYPGEKIGVIVVANSWRVFKMIDDVMAKAIGGSYPSYDWF